MKEPNDPFTKAAEEAIKEEVTVNEGSHELNPSLYEESYENMKYLSEGTEVNNENVKRIDQK